MILENFNKLPSHFMFTIRKKKLGSDNLFYSRNSKGIKKLPNREFLCFFEFQ